MLIAAVPEICALPTSFRSAAAEEAYRMASLIDSESWAADAAQAGARRQWNADVPSVVPEETVREGEGSAFPGFTRDGPGVVDVVEFAARRIYVKSFGSKIARPVPARLRCRAGVPGLRKCRFSVDCGVWLGLEVYTRDAGPLRYRTSTTPKPRPGTSVA